MRVIVACEKCQRQYDASGHQPGKRFRCRCGADVVVKRPRGHEAAVVRCSSCGAPREENAAHCGHCGADFTIHEQDLHTVCPSCLARVSDRARYCHHCAAILVAEGIAGDETPLACPVCGRDWKLTSRRLRDSQLNVMECQKCGGFWIGLATFDMLLDREARRPISAPPGQGRRPDLPRRTPYRPCAVCSELMNRRNFGRSSGVIVDVCGFHGMWFDAEELSHVVRWIRGGNLEAARVDVAGLCQSADRARKRKAQPISSAEPPRHRPLSSGSDDENPLGEIAEAAVTVLGQVLRWL